VSVGGGEGRDGGEGGNDKHFKSSKQEVKKSANVKKL